jgi:WD40 repeat protein
MKLKIRKYYILFGCISLAVIGILFVFAPQKPAKSNELYDQYNMDGLDSTPYVQYCLDSTYKVVYDTLLHVWNIKTGKKINEFEIAIFERIKSVVMHPSGKYLVIQEEFGELSVWNIRRGTQLNISKNFDSGDCNYFEFVEHGKYLLAVDYKEAFVSILKWPGLEHIATGDMGDHRSCFTWEERNGQLVFYYDICHRYIYKTVFKERKHGNSAEFTKPLLVDSVEEDSDFWNKY